MFEMTSLSLNRPLGLQTIIAHKAVMWFILHTRL